jgi:uncharacterized protein YbaR (Trm112 family)/ubiquinone/menaquinone biosynthesis C-methylase UbiE
MKTSLLAHLVCPVHGEALQLQDEQVEGKEIISGQLNCPSCKTSYKISQGVPRFTDDSHYSHSFGLQWNRYSKTQLDSHSGLPITKNRYQQVCRWNQDLRSGWGIEAGCGAGRFSEVLAQEPIQWICVDASSAVEANYRNNGHLPNIHIVQADLRQPPFRKASFDRMICLGVLQHTPHPRQSFLSLLPLLKGGGEFAFDIYAKTAGSWLWTKYWLRPITKRLPKAWLFQLLEWTVPSLIFAHDLMRFIPYVGRYLAHRLVPVCNYKYSFSFSKQQNLEWALLDTFDMLAPEHDHPKSLQEIQQWVREVPHVEQRVEFGPNGIIGQIELK